MKSISTFGETQGDMVPSITESVTVFSFDAVWFALKFHLVSPGKSANRTCSRGRSNFSGRRVYRDLKLSAEDATVLGISQAMRRTRRGCDF